MWSAHKLYTSEQSPIISELYRCCRSEGRSTYLKDPSGNKCSILGLEALAWRGARSAPTERSYTGALVRRFVFLDRHVPGVRRHGYLLATAS